MTQPGIESMSSEDAALLDTSAVIAVGAGVPVDLPDYYAISAMTLAELHVGALVARDPTARAARVRLLTAVEHEVDVLPIDDTVARRFGELVAGARQAGRKPKVADTLIAATALAHDLPVITCDEDFAAFVTHLTVVHAVPE